jgi:hypothetical protein
MKSLLLSLFLTIFVGYIFASLIDPNTSSWFSKLPTWAIYPFAIVMCIAYLVALYWGFTGIMQGQRLANFFGIMLCLMGLGLFVYALMMSAGKGQAKDGQFEYALNAQSADTEAIKPILSQANLQEKDIAFVDFWNLSSSQAKFSVCVQKGEIIGMSIKNATLSDVSSLSNLHALSQLSLNHCGLTKIENLNLVKAERLNLDDNSLENLTGINAPKVKWLDVKNNKLSSLEGIQNLPEARYFNYGGNEIKDFSAAKGHQFLDNLSK